MSISNENLSNPSYTRFPPTLFPMRRINWDGPYPTFRQEYVGLDPLEMLQQLAKTAEIRANKTKGGITTPALRYKSTKLSSQTLPLPNLQRKEEQRGVASTRKMIPVVPTDFQSPTKKQVNDHHQASQVTLGSRDQPRRPVEAPQWHNAAIAAHVIVPDDTMSSDASAIPNNSPFSLGEPQLRRRPAAVFPIVHHAMEESGRRQDMPTLHDPSRAQLANLQMEFQQRVCLQPRIQRREENNFQPRIQRRAEDNLQPRMQRRHNEDNLQPRIQSRDSIMGSVKDEWLERWMLKMDPAGVESIRRILCLATEHKMLQQCDKVKESYIIVRDGSLKLLRWLHHHATFPSEEHKKVHLRHIYSTAIEQLVALNEVTKKIGVTVQLTFTEYMSKWLVRNWRNPFPDLDQLQLMACETGMQTKQVNHWLINARTRKWRPAIRQAHDNGTMMLHDDSLACYWNYINNPRRRSSSSSLDNSVPRRRSSTSSLDSYDSSPFATKRIMDDVVMPLAKRIKLEDGIKLKIPYE